jgi:hypothetical protein
LSRRGWIAIEDGQEAKLDLLGKKHESLTLRLNPTN